MKRKLLFLTLAVLCLGTLASADTLVYSSNRAGFTTDVIDWGQLGPDSTAVTTPAWVVSTGGTNAAMAGNQNSSQFSAVVSGTSWTGNFLPGENLVWTGDPSTGQGGPFQIVLLNPVGGIGFGIQAKEPGPFSAQVEVYDAGLNYLSSFVVTGNSTSSMAGDNLFIGIQNKTAVNIGAIVISTNSNDFAIDKVGFNFATPEPGSLVLLASGLLGAGGMLRRKLGR